MIVKLLTEHYLEFLSLKGDCRCSFESTLVKMPHCWKSHVTAHLMFSWIYIVHLNTTSAASHSTSCLEVTLDL